MKTIIDCETGEITRVEFTNEEIKQQLVDENEAKNLEAQLKTQAEAKAALLERLGITEEEAKLLLG